MAKIPFDIKYRDKIESGEYKVETRSGKNVRIICWDKIGVPIVALVGDADDIVTYNRDGTTGQQMKLPSDLFIVTPEPELSEFEKACIRLYQDGRDDGFAGDNLSDENLKECSAELLVLARKELIKEGTSKNEMGTMLYDAGFEDGKAEALKDLPRWKKYNTPGASKGELSLTLYSGVYEVSDLFIDNGLYIPISDLEKLPKDE